MLDALYARFTHDQRVSLLLAALAVVSGGAAAAFGVWIGEAPGVLLAYLTAGLLVMAFVHSWRQPRRFLLLGILSVFGFFGFAVLHNLAYAAAELTRAYPIVSGFFGVVDAGCFLLSVLVAPAAAAIGFGAAAVTWFTQRDSA